MSADEPLTLCVQLWAHPGHEAGLMQFEDQVLALIPNHGGSVLQRVRRIGDGDAAFETHVISFPDDRSLQEYLDDPARLALTALRERSIARTVISPVVVVR